MVLYFVGSVGVAGVCVVSVIPLGTGVVGATELEKKNKKHH